MAMRRSYKATTGAHGSVRSVASHQGSFGPGAPSDLDGPVLAEEDPAQVERPGPQAPAAPSPPIDENIGDDGDPEGLSEGQEPGQPWGPAEAAAAGPSRRRVGTRSCRNGFSHAFWERKTRVLSPTAPWTGMARHPTRTEATRILKG